MKGYPVARPSAPASMYTKSSVKSNAQAVYTFIGGVLTSMASVATLDLK